MLQDGREKEEGQLKNKKGVIYSVRAPSMESVKHYVRLLYEPASESDATGHFFFQLLILVCSK